MNARPSTEVIPPIPHAAAGARTVGTSCHPAELHVHVSAYVVPFPSPPKSAMPSEMLAIAWFCLAGGTTLGVSCFHTVPSNAQVSLRNVRSGLLPPNKMTPWDEGS